MMIRGRHRGLPYELDRSIMLPNERHLVDDSTTTSDE
jgi:Trk-type K+ transport system membrane component